MASNRYYSGPPSDHFDGQRFFNPGQDRKGHSLRDIWQWKRTAKPAKWPQHVPLAPAVPEKRVEGIRITMVGHASLLVQVAGLNILTDPVWSKRASPFTFIGPRRVTPPGIAFHTLPPIDAVLVSHNHYDHLDTATLKRLHAEHAPLIVTPLGNDTIIRKAVPGARVQTRDWGESLDVGNATITLTPANHWSARGLRDRRMALWSGFWLQTPKGQIGFAGDTGYGEGAIFRDLHARYGAPDVALIPIGAYEPRSFMATQHVNPVEAVRIFRDIGARQALGIHWGTFQLTDEARTAPCADLHAALLAADIAPDRFVPAEPGGVYDFP
ncbi:MBL fold metallo-hydrolase [Acetobacter sp. TBRC 12305]|uniref:MBL fold metallo-hydrolase n=1 Tax=Acetobacter garciniae TaxID=2817435 RepID=A0A939KLL3_9PROT|nr:MBL fold metallo-hydrolase [Acetobacter garciniae]MBO1323560.1 MBL fold metallo-hydrolase [Acetobacter garciniae]MBX0343249.1 MBL fold metallo-hydrolase [Acetobacter garciniae]